MKKLLLASFLLFGMVSLASAQKKTKTPTPIVTKHVPAAPVAERPNAKNEGARTTSNSDKAKALDPTASRPAKTVKATNK